MHESPVLSPDPVSIEQVLLHILMVCWLHSIVVSYRRAVAIQQCLDPADVFDVCVMPKARVRLLDFNPPGGTTQPLMFTWEELHSAAELMCSSPRGSDQDCDLRVVTDRMHVQAGAQTVFGVPADTLELQGMTWGDVMQHLASEVSKQNLQDG